MLRERRRWRWWGRRCLGAPRRGGAVSKSWKYFFIAACAGNSVGWVRVRPRKRIVVVMMLCRMEQGDDPVKLLDPRGHHSSPVGQHQLLETIDLHTFSEELLRSSPSLVVNLEMRCILILCFAQLINVAISFSIREGIASDTVSSPDFPLLTLAEVMKRLKESATFGHFFLNAGATVVNVGAAYQDNDPIYGMNLANVFPSGVRIIGYECDANRVPLIKEKRPDVTLREMCVTTANIASDMKAMNVPQSFAALKVDIDSTDAAILDAILSEFHPLIIYSEIAAFDFPPPIDFTLVKMNFTAGRSKAGCWGMSINMAHRIYQHHGYSLIGAAHIDVMAVSNTVLYPKNGTSGGPLGDRPTDPYFWYQLVKSALHHNHWRGELGSPFMQLQHGVYEEIIKGDGSDGFLKPAIQLRSTDKVMARAAHVVNRACQEHAYLLALGDRCCAPQWFHGGIKPENCVCNLQQESK